MKKNLHILSLLCMLLGASGTGFGQSPFTQKTQSLVLYNGAAVASNRYVAISAQSTLATSYQLIMPTAAPTVGQVLQCASISGSDYTLSWTGAITGNGAATQVAFWNASGSLSGSNNLYWDNTNAWLGIGTNVPTQRVHVLGGNIMINRPGAGTAGKLSFQNPANTFASTFAADTQTANITYTLPTAQGAGSSFLTNNGSGTLSWAAATVAAWGLTGNASTTAGTNFVGTRDNQPLAFKTGSTPTERMRLTTAGYLGVGQTTPTMLVDVLTTDAVTNALTNVAIFGHNSSGGASITTNFGTAQKFTLKSNGTADRDAGQIAAFWTTATHASRSSALSFYTTNSATMAERVRIDNNGYFGINTTSPAASLDINGGFATRRALLTLSSGTNNNVLLGNSSFYKFTGPGAAFTITGFQGGVDGRRVRLLNRTGYSLTLKDQSTSSTDTCRVITGAGADVTFSGSSQLLDLIYNANSQRWLLGNLNTPTQGAIGCILYVTKTADQTATNSATLTNDNELTFTFPANQTWELNGEVEATNASNSIDMTHAITLPADGTTMKIFYTGVGPSGGGAVQGCNKLETSGAGSDVNITAGVSTLISFRGIIITSTSGGAVTYQWCQRVANASTTTVKAGSYWKITRVL